MNRSKFDIENMNTIANEFVVDLIYAVADKYSIKEKDVIEIFDKMKYWRVLNDTELCCLLAHDGVTSTLKSLEGRINENISRN